MTHEDSGGGQTYRDAGVDITGGDRAKQNISQIIRSTYTDGVLGGFGHFGGMYRAPSGAGQILVSSADSVGTKVLLAVHAGTHTSIGIDLVNHSVNDILCCGARPLFFLDYFATSSLDESTLNQIVEGMASACRDAGCALIGGETAQLPGIYRENTYDLAGFIVGAVQEDRIIDGSAVEPGQVVIGFESNGLHTNGYSLARSVFGLNGEDVSAIRSRLEQHEPSLGETIGEALLRPHRSYLPLLDRLESIARPTALAHVTGGGIRGNLERVIPEHCHAVIDTSSWSPPEVFELIQERGNVAKQEMFDVFNMGIGLLAVVPAGEVDEITAAMSEARIVGEIRESRDDDERVTMLGVDGD